MVSPSPMYDNCFFENLLWTSKRHLATLFKMFSFSEKRGFTEIKLLSRMLKIFNLHIPCGYKIDQYVNTYNSLNASRSCAIQFSKHAITEYVMIVNILSRKTDIILLELNI